MTIIDAIGLSLLRESTCVIFGYRATRNGERVDDPAAVANAVRRASSRDMSIPDAEAALFDLSSDADRKSVV